MWESKQNYRIRTGVIGRVLFSDISNLFFIRDGKGVIHQIDQEQARGIRSAEDNQTPGEKGRPPLFPGKVVEARMITLPIEHWHFIKENPSIYIGGLVEKAIRQDRA
jgi:hypothetical protein